MKKTLFLILAFVCALNINAQFKTGSHYRISAAKYDGSLVMEDYGNGSVFISYKASNTSYPSANKWWQFEEAGNNYWRIHNMNLNKYLTCATNDYSDWKVDELYGAASAESEAALWEILWEGDGFSLRNVAYDVYLIITAQEYNEYVWYSASIEKEPENDAEIIKIFDNIGQEVIGTGSVNKRGSIRINGKGLVLDRESSTYFATLPEKCQGTNKNYSGTLQYVIHNDSVAQDYLVQITGNGATNSAKGFTIRDVNCQETYNLTVSHEGKDILSRKLKFTYLPLVDISVGSVNGTTYTKGSVRFVDSEGTEKDTTLTATFKIRGATSQRYDKKSLNVKLYEADGVTDLDRNVFGLREDHTWILDAMAIDRIRMRNRICFDVWNEIDQLPYDTKYEKRNGTAGRFVEVFMNGNYHGLYCFTDKINRKLLNLTKVKIDTIEGNAEITQRGILYKGVQWGDDVYLKNTSSAVLPTKATFGNWELDYPEDYPTQTAWEPLRNLINFNHTSKQKFESEFDEHYFMPNLVNYVVEQFAFNLQDNGMKNMFMSFKNIQKTNQCIFTVWDMDSSLGGYWNGNHNDIKADTTYATRVHLLSRLFSNNFCQFRDRVRVRWNELKENTLSYENVVARLNNYKDLFLNSGAWQREVSRWEGNPVTIENLENEVEYVADWYQRNMAYLDQILPPYEGEIDGIQTIFNDDTYNNYGYGANNYGQGTNNYGHGTKHNGNEKYYYDDGTPKIYTPDGRLLPEKDLKLLPRGIYIVGGRKIVR